MVVSCHPKSLPLGIRVIVALFVFLLHFGTVALQEPQENAPSKPNLVEAVQILSLFEMKIANDPANVPQDVKDKWSAVWTKTGGTAILKKVMDEHMENGGKLSEETQKLIYEIVREVKALPHLKTMDPFLGILHGKYMMWYKIKDKFSGQIVKFKHDILDMDPHNETLKSMYDDLKTREREFGFALSSCEIAVTEYGQKWKDSKTQPGEQDQKLVLDEVRNVGNTVRERVIDTPLSLVLGWQISASGSDGSLDASDDEALAAASKSNSSWKVVLAVVQSLLVLLVGAALLLVYFKKVPENPKGGGAAIGGLKKSRVTSIKTSKSTLTTSTKSSSKPYGTSTSKATSTTSTVSKKTSKRP